MVEYPEPRNYDAVAYGISVGYGSTSDDGSSTGCGGGTPPCHRRGIAEADVFDGNYFNADAKTVWASGAAHRLPASLYLTARPVWWKGLPFPATGPDVTGGNGPGGHSYGNPAYACYVREMSGTDGGSGGPLDFNAERCYGNAAASSR